MHCILMNNKDCFDLIIIMLVKTTLTQSQEQKAKRAEQIVAPWQIPYTQIESLSSKMWRWIGAGSAGIPLPLFCSVTSHKNGPFLSHSTKENHRQWSACPFLGSVASQEGRGSRRMSQRYTHVAGQLVERVAANQPNKWAGCDTPPATYVTLLYVTYTHVPRPGKTLYGAEVKAIVSTTGGGAATFPDSMLQTFVATLRCARLQLRVCICSRPLQRQLYFYGCQNERQFWTVKINFGTTNWIGKINSAATDWTGKIKSAATALYLQRQKWILFWTGKNHLRSHILNRQSQLCSNKLNR